MPDALPAPIAPAASAVRPLMLISGGPTTTALWAPLAELFDLAFLSPQAAQTAAGMGLPAAPLAQAVNSDVQESIQNTAAVLTAKVAGELPQIAARMQAIYGAAGPALLNSRLPDWFPGFASHLLGSTVSILAALEVVGSSGRTIAGCITHEDVSLDTRAMVGWANARDIPTLHVPHAPCHLLPGEPDIHRETRAHYIAAGGVAGAKFYADSGHDPAAIRLTGVPQWDEYYAGHLPERAEARRVLDAPKDGLILTYMTTWAQTTGLRGGWEDEQAAGLAAVIEQARGRGAYLIIKVHPTDGRPDTEQKFAAELDRANLAGLVTRQHMTYILRASDGVIAQGPSNACLVAAIAGVPSVYLQTEGFEFATPLPFRCQPAGLGAALDGALASRGDGAWDEMIEQYNVVHPTGGAADRIVDWAIELCK